MNLERISEYVAELFVLVCSHIKTPIGIDLLLELTVTAVILVPHNRQVIQSNVWNIAVISHKF